MVLVYNAGVENLTDENKEALATNVNDSDKGVEEGCRGRDRVVRVQSYFAFCYYLKNMGIQHSAMTKGSRAITRQSSDFSLLSIYVSGNENRRSYNECIWP